VLLPYQRWFRLLRRPKEFKRTSVVRKAVTVHIAGGTKCLQAKSVATTKFPPLHTASRTTHRLAVVE